MKSQSILPSMLRVGSNSNLVQEDHRQQPPNNLQHTQHTNTDKNFLRQQIAKGWNMQRYNLLPEITQQGRGRALSDVSLLLRHNGHSALSTTFSDDNDSKICNTYKNQGNNVHLSVRKSESLSSRNPNEITDQTFEIPVPHKSVAIMDKRALPPINLEIHDNSRPRFMTVLDGAPPPASVLTMSASEIIPCSDDPRDSELYI